MRPKIKEGIFIGPQITRLCEDQDLSKGLNCSTERMVWKAFKNVCRNFPDIEKAENYSEILWDLISSYGAMGCNKSLKFDVFRQCMIV